MPIIPAGFISDEPVRQPGQGADYGNAGHFAAVSANAAKEVSNEAFNALGHLNRLAYHQQTLQEQADVCTGLVQHFTNGENISSDILRDQSKPALQRKTELNDAMEKWTAEGNKFLGQFQPAARAYGAAHMMQQRLKIQNEAGKQLDQQYNSGLISQSQATLAGIAAQMDNAPGSPTQNWEAFKSENQDLTNQAANTMDTMRQAVNGPEMQKFESEWIDARKVSRAERQANLNPKMTIDIINSGLNPWNVKDPQKLKAIAEDAFNKQQGMITFQRKAIEEANLKSAQNVTIGNEKKLFLDGSPKAVAEVADSLKQAGADLSMPEHLYKENLVMLQAKQQSLLHPSVTTDAQLLNTIERRIDAGDYPKSSEYSMWLAAGMLSTEDLKHSYSMADSHRNRSQDQGYRDMTTAKTDERTHIRTALETWSPMGQGGPGKQVMAEVEANFAAEVEAAYKANPNLSQTDIHIMGTRAVFKAKSVFAQDALQQVPTAELRKIQAYGSMDGMKQAFDKGEISKGEYDRQRTARELLDELQRLQWSIQADKQAEATAAAQASEKKGWFGAKKPSSANPGIGAGE